MNNIKESTRELTSFLADLNYQSFSHTTVNMAKMCIQDLIAVAVAGSSKKNPIFGRNITLPNLPTQNLVSCSQDFLRPALSKLPLSMLYLAM